MFCRDHQPFKLACEYDREKLGIAIDLGWRADRDHVRILQKLIPNFSLYIPGVVVPFAILIGLNLRASAMRQAEA